MLHRRNPKKGKSTRFGWTKAEVEFFGHVLRLTDQEMEQAGVDNPLMQRRFTRGWIERTFQWQDAQDVEDGEAGGGAGVFERNAKRGLRKVLFEDQFFDVLSELHRRRGHCRGETIWEECTRLYYGPSRYHCRWICRLCKRCQLNQYQPSNRTPLRHHQSRHFNDQIQHDLTFLENVTLPDGRTVIGLHVIKDTHTKWIMAFLIEDKTARAIAPGLIAWYTIMGPAKVSQNDNGGEFMAEARFVQQKYGVRVVVSKPYTPRSNGGVERGNGQLKQIIWKLVEDGPEGCVWPDVVDEAVWQYNSTWNSAIKMCPYRAVFGMFPRVKNRAMNAEDDRDLVYEVNALQASIPEDAEENEDILDGELGEIDRPGANGVDALEDESELELEAVEVRDLTNVQDPGEGSSRGVIERKKNDVEGKRLRDALGATMRQASEKGKARCQLPPDSQSEALICGVRHNKQPRTATGSNAQQSTLHGHLVPKPPPRACQPTTPPSPYRGSSPLFVKQEDAFDGQQAFPFDDSPSRAASEDSDLVFLGYKPRGQEDRDEGDPELIANIEEAKRLSRIAGHALSQDRGNTRKLNEDAGAGPTLSLSSSLSPPPSSPTNPYGQRSSRAQDDALMKRNQDRMNAKNTRFWNKTVKTFQIGEIVTVIANPNNPRKPGKTDQRRILGRIAALDPTDKYRYVVHCRWGRIEGSFLSEALNTSEGLEDPSQDVDFDPTTSISLQEALVLQHPRNERQQPTQQQQKTSISTQTFRTHNVNSTPKKFRLRSAHTHKRGRSSGSNNAAINPPTSKRAKHVAFVASPLLHRRRAGLRTAAEKRKTMKAREAEAEIGDNESSRS